MDGLLKYRLWGPNPKVSELVSLTKGLRICVTNKFPNDAANSGPETALWEPVV